VPRVELGTLTGGRRADFLMRMVVLLYRPSLVVFLRLAWKALSLSSIIRHDGV